MTHLRPDPPRVLYWVFGSNGLVTATLFDPAQTWQERLAQCTRALIALPEATELGFVQNVAGILSGWNALDRGPPRLAGIQERHFRYNPHLRSRFVPDARGAIVVTDAHLERAHDLSDWSVQALSHSRHLVQAGDLAAWLAQPEPAPEVLTAARADFGAMILTEADIERNQSAEVSVKAPPATWSQRGHERGVTGRCQAVLGATAQRQTPWSAA